MRAYPYLVLLGTVACGTPSGPGDPGPAAFRLTPTGAWAGGTISLESEAFRGLAILPNVRLGLVEYPTMRVDDTTLTVRLPSTAGGLYDPVVMLPDTEVLLPQLSVWGFAGTRRYGPDEVWFPWDVYVWPEGSTSIMGATAGNGLTTIDLATDEAETFPGLLSSTQLRGPGATYQDSVFVLRATGESARSWKLTATPQLLGEHPEFIFTRQVMRLGLHTWILAFNNRVETWTRPDSASGYTVTSIAMNESSGVHLSPRKDRATIRAAQVPGVVPGVPVFTAPTGELAYYVGLRSSTAVDWSADGSLLAMGGLPAGGSLTSGQVFLLNSATGEPLGMVLTDRPVFGIAIDERRPLLYVGVTSATGRPAVRVYQRPALTLIAEMDVPQTELVCGILADCFGGVLALAADEVYAFYGWNGPTRSTRFFLPPP